MTRRTTLALVVLAVVIGVLTGCGSHTNGKGSGVDQSLTEQAARDRSYDYLRQTLAALPPGVSLAYHPDSPVLGDARPGVTVPCNDDNTVEHPPWNVQIGYWLVGVPPGQDRHYVDLITTYWTDKGWIRPGAAPDYTVATTPDGYSIALQDAGKGHGSLSLTTFSPCFPESAQGTTTPQPSTIARPNGT